MCFKFTHLNSGVDFNGSVHGCHAKGVHESFQDWLIKNSLP